MKLSNALLLSGAMALVGLSPAAAQDTNADGYVSVLLPIAFSASQVLPGAYGTQWAAEIWMHNASAVDIDALQPAGPCTITPCNPELPAGFLGQLSSIESNNNNGAMIHLPAAVAGEIDLSARLLELSRRAQPTGVEIPAVREDQFFRTPRWFLGIPVAEGIRSALRVYDPRARKGTMIQADFYGPDGQLVATRILNPGNDPRADETNGPPLVPTLDGLLSITDSIPALRQLGRYHIKLTPLGDYEFWGMVSTTDNETQHVLLITAQP